MNKEDQWKFEREQTTNLAKINWAKFFIVSRLMISSQPEQHLFVHRFSVFETCSVFSRALMTYVAKQIENEITVRPRLSMRLIALLKVSGK